MKTPKHFALAALLVVGATLSVSTPAGAQTFDLMPTGAEPGATGQATITKVRWAYSFVDPVNNGGGDVYTCRLSVTCQGLTPGARYSTSAGDFKASRSGTGSATDNKYYLVWRWLNGVMYPPPIYVYRIDPDGSFTLVLRGVP